MNRPVALRKESVDRNTLFDREFMTIERSLSARRAWIEICMAPMPSREPTVSLSARRAWIEI